MSESAILPGAEPFSAEGGPCGVLVLHGFTGCPQSMRGLAEALAADGFGVELPRLPGHGTTLDDMATTGWSDWTRAAESAYASLAERCERVVVAGLSMGGALTLWVASRHPEVAGIALINATASPPEPSPVAALREQLERGVRTIPGVGGDIKRPGVEELAYPQVALSSLITLFEGLTEVREGLDRIVCPTLILNSPEDHVVPPEQLDLIAAKVRGPVERIALENSYHVATLDNDREQIEHSVVAFARRVCNA